MSALLLLYVNWGALQEDCLKRDTCDIWEVSSDAGSAGGGGPGTAAFICHPFCGMPHPPTHPPPSQVAIRRHPLSGRWSAWTLLAVVYLALFSAYWVAALASAQPWAACHGCRGRVVARSGRTVLRHAVLPAVRVTLDTLGMPPTPSPAPARCDPLAHARLGTNLGTLGRGGARPG